MNNIFLKELIKKMHFQKIIMIAYFEHMKAIMEITPTSGKYLNEIFIELYCRKEFKLSIFDDSKEFLFRIFIYFIT